MWEQQVPAPEILNADAEDGEAAAVEHDTLFDAAAQGRPGLAEQFLGRRSHQFSHHRSPAGGVNSAQHRRVAIGYTAVADDRSEEHTSELQSLMRISYAVFCLKKKK